MALFLKGPKKTEILDGGKKKIYVERLSDWGVYLV